jgi:imidazolonepropionase-like amidohydrolase
MTDQLPAATSDPPRAPFARFCILAILLVSLPLPFLLAMEYHAGGFSDCLPVLFGWLALAVFYWWPVGAFFFRWRRGWVSRLVLGYLLSLPLYFLCLFLIYPAFDAHFHPRNAATWGIYFGDTPIFFLFVLILFLLTRRARLTSRITTWLVGIAFVFGLAAPIFYSQTLDRYTWPQANSLRLNIVNARLVDAAGNRIVDDKHVHIEDGRIVAIVDAASDPSDWPKLDAAGKYLLPGLIDVHTHLQAPIRSTLAPFDFKFLVECIFSQYAPNRRAYVESGVTSVRDLGGPAAPAYQMRAALQAHRLLGPRLFVVGRLVTSPHGHPVGTIWNSQVSRQGAILASDSASLISGLECNYAAGPPDAVKFIYGTIGLAKERLSPALLEQGIAWASSHKLISVVHAETTEEVTEAARAGATGVEHVASIEALPDDLIAVFRKNDTFADPTFGELQTALTLRHMDEDKRKAVLLQRGQFVRRIHDAGVRLVIGTDAPLVPYGTGLLDEFDQFVAAGFSPAEILTFASRNNAAYLGKADALGQIAPGFFADLLLVQDNPLQDVHRLRKPSWVMLNGQIVFPRPPK